MSHVASNTPTIVISFDFELGWGALDTNCWRQREAAGVYVRLREVFAELMPLMRELEIPSTWAFVAGMIDDQKHQLDHLPPNYRKAALDFLSSAHESTKDARDLLDRWSVISRYSEIATHTYSHVYAEYQDVTADMYVEDVDISLSILEQTLGFRPKTIIFPRDQSNYLAKIDVSHNLDSRLSPHFDRGRRGAIRRAADSIKASFAGAPASRIITFDSDRIHQTGSLYYNWIGGSYEYIKSLQLVLNERAMLKRNSDPDCIHHIWLHPYNLSESRSVYDSFVRFLYKISSMRDQGNLQIRTMTDISNEYRRNQRSVPSSSSV